MNNFLTGQSLSIYLFQDRFSWKDGSLGSVSGFVCLQRDLPRDVGIRFCAWLIFN